jgi:hypothetical protein
MNQQKLAGQIDDINQLLGAAIPTLGLAFGAINMVREMFRRQAAGEAAAEFAENVALIHAGAASMAEKSAAWFAEHPEYDPATGQRRA